MRMEGELLISSMENGHTTDTGTELGRDQFVGKSEDHMKIGAGQESPSRVFTAPRESYTFRPCRIGANQGLTVGVYRFNFYVFFIGVAENFS